MTVREVVAGVLSPVTNVLSKREERKQTVAKVEGALALAKAEGKANLELSQSEWEKLSLATQKGSIKDEYALGLITLPVVALILGGLFYTPLFDSALDVIEVLKTLDYSTVYGTLFLAVVGSAIGIKTFKQK